MTQVNSFAYTPILQLCKYCNKDIDVGMFSNDRFYKDIPIHHACLVELIQKICEEKKRDEDKQ